MNTKQLIKQELLVIGTLMGKEITQPLLNAYIDSLSDLDDGLVLSVLKNWIKSSRGFPLPVDIRNKVYPEITDEDNAQDVANLIIAAVSRCGYTNPDTAERKVGSLGWEVVRRMGGWKRLCEAINNDNEGMFRAQIRDYAETVAAKAKRDELHLTPMLESNSEHIKTIISQTFKHID